MGFSSLENDRNKIKDMSKGVPGDRLRKVVIDMENKDKKEESKAGQWIGLGSLAIGIFIIWTLLTM